MWLIAVLLLVALLIPIMGIVVDSPIDFPLLGRSTIGAGLYLATVGATLLLAAGALFRTRDVN